MSFGIGGTIRTHQEIRCVLMPLLPVLSSKVELTFRISLPGRAIFHRKLNRVFILLHSPYGYYGLFSVLGNTLVIIERGYFLYTTFRNDILYPY